MNPKNKDNEDFKCFSCHMSFNTKHNMMKHKKIWSTIRKSWLYPDDDSVGVVLQGAGQGAQPDAVVTAQGDAHLHNTPLSILFAQLL